jgi:hypothetical protein
MSYITNNPQLVRIFLLNSFIMWNIDLIQIHRYYEKLVTLMGRSHMREWGKKEIKRVNMVNTLSIQE